MLQQVFFVPPPPPPLPQAQGIVEEPGPPPPVAEVFDEGPEEVQVLEIPSPAEEVEEEQGVAVANAGTLRGAFQNRGLRRSKFYQ